MPILKGGTSPSAWRLYARSEFHDTDEGEPEMTLGVYLPFDRWLRTSDLWHGQLTCARMTLTREQTEGDRMTHAYPSGD